MGELIAKALELLNAIVTTAKDRRAVKELEERAKKELECYDRTLKNYRDIVDELRRRK